MEQIKSLSVLMEKKITATDFAPQTNLVLGSHYVDMKNKIG
jgi:hypothetical protein